MAKIRNLLTLLIEHLLLKNTVSRENSQLTVSCHLLLSTVLFTLAHHIVLSRLSFLMNNVETLHEQPVALAR